MTKPPVVSSDRRWGWFTNRTDERFASQIRDLGDLDEPVRQVLSAALGPGETPLYMLKAPFQGKLLARQPQRTLSKFFLPWEFTPDWVMALTPGRLLLVRLAEAGQPAELIPVPLDTLLSVQQGVILLYSWFTVAWIEAGKVRRETVYFNAVCEKLFLKMLAMIRGPLTLLSKAPDLASQQNRETLAPLPFKFKNLIPARILLPGETVRHMLYRPAMIQKNLKLFSRIVAPRMTLVLSDDFLILAEEDQTWDEESYGFIVTCLPLSNIQRTEVVRKGNSLVWTIGLEHLAAGEDLKIKFPPGVEAPLKDFAGAVKLHSA